MLLKTLLPNILKWIEAHPIDTGALIVKIEASNHSMPVEDFILKLDIRHLGVLRSLIPRAFPRKLREGVLDINMNIHGHWRVDPKETV